MTDIITRSFLLDDLVVRSEGDGRTVEAYAAVFGQPTEIRDHFGHYNEVIDRAAFNVAINRTKGKPRVLFNHGKDLYGNPSDRFAMPIGTPESITADSRGLRTVTRIAKTELGDEVLELMRSGAIDGFSFQGAPIKSQTLARTDGDELPTIVRQQLGLTEYGPGVFVAYSGAQVMAIRTEQLADEIGHLDHDQLAELVDVLRSRIPDLGDLVRSEGPGSADDTSQPDTAARDFNHQRRLMAARLRGIAS
jgi:HK97 family phage prohead protease